MQFSLMLGCYLYYFGECDLTIALKSFVRPVCEYANIIFMDAFATHLYKLDLVQKMAGRMCNTTFSSLATHCNVSFIGLFCNLLDLQCREPLQNFCPILTSVIHAYSFCLVTDDIQTVVWHYNN